MRDNGNNWKGPGQYGSLQRLVSSSFEGASTTNHLNGQHNNMMSSDEEGTTAFEAAWKISEIVNPDGSMTVRKMVVGPSGSKVVREDVVSPTRNKVVRENEHPLHYSPQVYQLPQIYDSYKARIDQHKRRQPATTTKADNRRDNSNSTTSSTETPVTNPSRTSRHVSWDLEVDDNNYNNKTGSTPIHIFEDPNDSEDISYLTSDLSHTQPETPRIPLPETSNYRMTTPKNSIFDPYAGSNVLFEREERTKGRGQSSPQRPINPMSIEIEQDATRTNAGSNYDPYHSFSAAKPESLPPGPGKRQTGFDSVSNYRRNVRDEKRQSPSPPRSGPELVDKFNKLSQYKNSERKATQTSPEYTLHDNSHDDPGSNSSVGNSSQLFTVTVVKDQPNAKIGIRIGLKYFTSGPRLVVTYIQENGPFTGTPVECGDIVVSVNGKDCLKDPRTSEVLDIVRKSKDYVTIMIQKRSDNEDFHSVNDVTEASRQYGQGKNLTEGNRDAIDQVHKLDRTSRIQIGCVETGESITNKSTRRMFLNVDGSISVVTDRLHNRKNPVVSRESFNVSGDVILSVRKRSRDQDVGITVTEKKSFDSSGVVVSEINKTSLFANSPLKVGDTILVVNKQDFRNNPNTKDVMEAIETAVGELTICARKSSNGLKDFIKQEKKTPVKAKQRRMGAGQKSSAYFNKGLEFDERSYDDSVGSYNSSKSVYIRKSDPDEDLGIEFLESQYGSVPILVVGKISAKGHDNSGLNRIQTGDIVLTINGLNFQEQPNAQLAQKELRDGDSPVRIEFQRLGSEIPLKTSALGSPKGKESLPADSGIESESLSELSVDSRPHTVIDEDVSALGSFLGGVSAHVRSFDKADQLDVKDGTASMSSKSSASQVTMPVLRRPSVEFITIAKSSPDQEVGLAMAVIDGALRVTEVSPTGLLAGRPILPGDTIASINGKDFLENPDAREAAEIVTNALAVVNFEIQRSKRQDKPRGKCILCRKLACPRFNQDNKLVRILSCSKKKVHAT